MMVVVTTATRTAFLTAAFLLAMFARVTRIANWFATGIISYTSITIGKPKKN